MNTVPGTRFRFTVTLDQKIGAHRAVITDEKGRGISAAKGLSAVELLELCTALKAAEKEVWKRDQALPPREILMPRQRSEVIHALLA